MMDDSCAVCAEALEWVAYGPCGHREVCATCVARLRVVCKDRRCCLCQSDSAVVFITKALGEYTRFINDFSVFPDDVKEGKAGSFWYNEGIQAFFDDFTQYKAIGAMSKLSCIDCDKSDGKGKEGSKRKGKFKSIDHLRSHISNRHELFMCSLCLEGRKVFISEQKLYNRAQLECHFEKGDLDVDGDESERCGFSGHPLCKFCQLNFYGDNELYFHMSTDHFTCHICQRQHPGSHQYYRDYDDLEKHFRHTHFLCEDYSCLEMKFIVFTTAAEMKRHRNLEHGRNVSRLECNASLQISTCFGHRERTEGNNSSRAMGQIANAELLHGVSSSTRLVNGGTSLTSTNAVRPAEHVASSDHSQASGLNSSNGVLEASAFPPLPSSSNRRNRKSRNNSAGTTKPPQLHRRYDGSLSMVNSGQPSSFSTSSSSLAMNTSNSGMASLLDPASSSQNSLLTRCEDSTVSIGLTTVRVNSSTGSAHLLSKQNVINEVGLNSPSLSTNELPASASRGGNQKMEGMKTLVERICAELGFDKDKYAAFKLVSKEYRRGVISAREYLAHVHQFGLVHLTEDLARLCPDLEKQMELLEVRNSSIQGSDSVKNALDSESSSSLAKSASKKGKEKCIDFQRERDKSSNVEASQISRKGKEKCDGVSTAVKGKEKGKSSSNESKGKSTVTFDAGAGDDGSSSTKTGVQKNQKKTPKFLRARLGESSGSVISDPEEPKSAPNRTKVSSGRSAGLTGLPGGGVWQNGGGRRLVMTIMAKPQPLGSRR